MPIYEYSCHNCGEKFEKLVSINADETELTCPKCGGTQVKKLPSIFGTSGSSTTHKFTSSSAEACQPTG